MTAAVKGALHVWSVLSSPAFSWTREYINRKVEASLSISANGLNFCFVFRVRRSFFRLFSCLMGRWLKRVTKSSLGSFLRLTYCTYRSARPSLEMKRGCMSTGRLTFVFWLWLECSVSIRMVLAIKPSSPSESLACVAVCILRIILCCLLNNGGRAVPVR